MSTSFQNEGGRLAALHRYSILDTPSEEAFDAIVRLASEICQTPIALIVLIDEARQWFKARVGLSITHTPREIAFCRHAIDGKGTCVISDALADPRFRDNPLVTADPKIRFYAGVPLVTPDGFSLGTLCVIDRIPRELTPHQHESLKLLARETMTQLELRRAARELAHAEQQLQSANVELQAFGAAAAHDLRAPLRQIDGFASVILEDFAAQLPGEVADHLQRIRSSCGVMNELIAALLRLSRVSNEQLELVPTDLSQLAGEIGADLARREPSRSVQFTAVPGAVAIADHGLARVLLENLLSNAWKFTRTRSEPRVEFGWQRRGPVCEYFVRDNGVGFATSKSRLHIQPFQRLHQDRTFEGVGLGLTIAERIARRHGGELTIEGHPGQGAVVTFTLQSSPRQ